MKNHGGVHEWDLTKAQARGAVRVGLRRLFNIASIIYGPAIGCTKVSILLLYRRTFSPQKNSHFDRAIRLFIVILSLFYVAITIAKIFECTPRARIWDKRRPGTCVSISNLLNASGAFNTLTDILLLLIPVKVSWTLNTSVKRKVGVVLLFTFGFLAPAFSIVGLVVRIRTSKSPDVTYNQPEILLWGAAEITTGLICVCIPPLAALIHPRHNRRQSTYINVHSSDGRLKDSSRRTRPVIWEERDLLASSDVELQYSGTVSGVAFPPPLVTTGISGGRDAHERRDENCRLDNVGPEIPCEKAVDAPREAYAIGVTTTVEQFYR
ncbi:hypothetical protein HO133_002608 [Letharia lupina]|uniref:Rhodopsin domain-containing protein n=1 Tax=Letharia lupina TaxID=560253 RepID=A0A8H6CCR7_9LECA|nr:uncharacterized protein HO133_002608 [Letharia lupina]KAF6220928.1 hypothetical protein HO133_002608 [Letharia lupina]